MGEGGEGTGGRRDRGFFIGFVATMICVVMLVSWLAIRTWQQPPPIDWDVVGWGGDPELTVGLATKGWDLLDEEQRRDRVARISAILGRGGAPPCATCGGAQALVRIDFTGDYASDQAPMAKDFVAIVQHACGPGPDPR